MGVTKSCAHAISLLEVLIFNAKCFSASAYIINVLISLRSVLPIPTQLQGERLVGLQQFGL